jgi:hypothetical protein
LFLIQPNFGQGDGKTPQEMMERLLAGQAELKSDIYAQAAGHHDKAEAEAKAH